SIIFGTNSNRQPNEPLSIRYLPSENQIPNSKVRTTYLEIDQFEKTNSCILFYFHQQIYLELKGY
ncbi:unnamed protein product, partial [Rotaria sp. Silwood2]